MLASFAIVLPVFGLIVIGYLARWTGFLGDRAGDGLSEFVFSLAVPCLIFRTLARIELPAVQPWGYWIAYFTGVAIVWALATILARRAFGLTGTAAVVAGFSAGQANTVLMGIPMILKAYGEAGAVPLFLLIAIHLPITVTLATLLAEGLRASWASVLKRLALHPILLAIAAGALANPVAGAIPAPAWQIMDLVAAASMPCSLISMGIALRRHGLESGIALPGLISVLKLVVHPLIVFVLATQVFSMPPAWAGVAVLFAACPTGVNAYLFAQRYGEGVAIASGSVAVSTALALVTIAIWLKVLGVG